MRSLASLLIMSAHFTDLQSSTLYFYDLLQTVLTPLVLAGTGTVYSNSGCTFMGVNLYTKRDISGKLCLRAAVCMCTCSVRWTLSSPPFM